MYKKEEDLSIRFSVSLHQNLLDELDIRITKNGYASRSELVRDMIREKLVEDAWSDPKSESGIGVLVIIYDHHQRELNQKMLEVQHHNNTFILCNTHIHMDDCNCLETIIIKGKPYEIEKVSLEIAGLKGVKFSKLTRASSFEKNE
ncbi:nickel-responsive transcriptional regulator NikR [Helicobacter sp. 13S00477-4]|uniref:nickel-responsive transcriptional regulator NikR n=1 Tax=Helicobacter sp. 13S00477-4 TaxID=1905759 RepID=UPI000BA60D6F|nr:nickel-responsive transcriptional regulator NikR [Helicobacter sp. 13S00477-4]PAF50667.1 nickel responsive regulator [Helicobacter sp. 13S00477-4]